MNEINWQLFLFSPQKTEASSHDRINMTEFWLEYDQKIFTMTNINN